MLANVLILGGDLRQIRVGEEFFSDSYNVSFCGFDREFINSEFELYDNLFDALNENDIIIMGLPVSKDAVKLNTPLYKGEILLDDIVKCAKCQTVFLGGIPDEIFIKKLKRKTENVFDYYSREELIIKNIIPTVEGAISIAIEETPFTLYGSNVLVTGFGRISKLLARYLDALGANVTVSARKLHDLAWIETLSYKNIRTSEICKTIGEYDIIFNTVPATVIDKNCIDNVKPDVLIIDLASKPGGVDFNYAREKGIKTIWALSLPGKVAPLSAGKIIKETIKNILDELGG
ncbi:MAG: dipicolinate synthase subunit DpsA [Clostridia bacterium]|nr:dipicolinate synthase subunit DpsA [Clostridia bacterium]